MATRFADNVIDCPGALILGGGLAGLFTALKLAPYPATVLVNARAGGSGSSVWAQGGVSAAMGDDDSWELHAADTDAAGAGLCDPVRTALLAQEAPARIEDLIRFGVPFDRTADGKLALSLEAAHSRKRIVHAGADRAGLVITRTLADAARNTPSISFLEGLHAVELAMDQGRVIGLFARAGFGAETRLVFLRAHQIVFATGGMGAVFAVTTNPQESRGEGLGMAARAGAIISDPEFMQFHPTALVSGDPAPLVSETVRGAGATLLNEKGMRFMCAIHPLAELAPRDVVARGVHREIARGGKVFLDARESVGAAFPQKFPAVYEGAKQAGIDPVTDLVPIAPAAHYHMGGIATDENGRSSLNGLWASGECASTGVHGANRLASNSLLEGLVFGARVADDIRGQNTTPKTVDVPSPQPGYAVGPVPLKLRQAMSRYVGIERDANGLRTALDTIGSVERAANGDLALLNVTAAAKLATAAAIARQESRGGHFRSDYPQTFAQAKRTFMTLADAERLALESECSTETASTKKSAQ